MKVEPKFAQKKLLSAKPRGDSGTEVVTHRLFQLWDRPSFPKISWGDPPLYLIRILLQLFPYRLECSLQESHWPQKPEPSSQVYV